MHKVLLTGTYNSSNKGDAAMETSMAKSLKAALEDVEIIVSSPFPEIDRDFYAPFKVVKCNRRRLVWASFQLVRAFLWGFIKKHLRYDLRVIILDEEIQIYLESDLIIDLSGDMITEDYGPHVAYSHYIPILMALFLHRPVFLCAQSIGPFRLTRFLAKYILSEADFITARDEITLRYLEEIGIRGESVFATADIAFLLDTASSDRIDEILRAEKATIGGNGILGVSLSQLVESKYGRNPLSKEIGFVSLFADTLDRVCSELNLEVVFVPHVVGPSKAKDDRIIMRKIRDKMKAKAHVIEREYRPEELKGIISRSCIFLGARMHANIAALSSAVPVAAISYSHKTPGIMKMLGQEDFVCSIETLTGDEIYEKVKAIHMRRDTLSAGLREKILGIQTRVAKNIDLIVHFLEPTKNGSCSR